MGVIYPMLSLREPSSNRKGFTLVEMVLYIGILSILLTSLCMVLSITSRASLDSESLDMALFNGRFAMEYIKGEIISADRIITSSEFDNLDEDFPNNIGFVSLEEELYYDFDGKVTNSNYNFRTYYVEDDKLVRVAYNTSNPSFYDSERLSGYNQICDGIVEANNCSLDKENRLIRLSFSLDRGTVPLLLKTAISIRCDIE